MKIYGIPITSNAGLDSPISPHFGRAPAYALVSENKDFIVVIKNSSKHMGGFGEPPDILIDRQIDILLCTEIGSGAIKKFEDMGVEVYVGARGTIDETIDLYNAGQLEMATDENACKEQQHGND